MRGNAIGDKNRLNHFSFAKLNSTTSVQLSALHMKATIAIKRISCTINLRSTDFSRLKGKRAISIARKFKGWQKNFAGEYFWSRGYFVSMVRLDESMVIEYFRNQETSPNLCSSVLRGNIKK